MLAVPANFPQRVQFLLELWSDINLRDTYGRTARDSLTGRGKKRPLPFSMAGESNSQGFN